MKTIELYLNIEWCYSIIIFILDYNKEFLNTEKQRILLSQRLWFITKNSLCGSRNTSHPAYKNKQT